MCQKIRLLNTQDQRKDNTTTISNIGYETMINGECDGNESTPLKSNESYRTHRSKPYPTRSDSRRTHAWTQTGPHSTSLNQSETPQEHSFPHHRVPYKGLHKVLHRRHHRDLHCMIPHRSDIVWTTLEWMAAS